MTAQTAARAMNGATDAPGPGALVERLRARLETLTAERQTYLDTAQRTMAAYDATIAELTALLTPPVAAESEG
jgi:hypothetical protein